MKHNKFKPKALLQNAVTLSFPIGGQSDFPYRRTV